MTPIEHSLPFHTDTLDWLAFERLAKILHARFEQQGFTDTRLELDVARAFPNGVAPLVVLLERYRKMGREITVGLPSDARLQKLFVADNWAHALSPDEYPASDASDIRGLHHFSDDRELNDLVNRQIRAKLGEIRFADGVAQAFEWTLNEIAGNALVHSGTGGGWMQVTVFPNTKHLAIVVADAGLGIPTTIREAYRNDMSDEQTIEFALRKGVTSKPDFGQGKGLTGALEIVKENRGGILRIFSGKGAVGYEDGRFNIKPHFPPFAGTLVDIQFNTEAPIAVSRALWGHEPVDFTETLYGADTPIGVLRLRLRDEAASFGNRVTGERIRTKIENLLQAAGAGMLEVDFENVELLASSFADEVFGKLAVSLGIINFSRRLRLLNLNNFCHGVIDDVVQARMAQTVAKQDHQQ